MAPRPDDIWVYVYVLYYYDPYAEGHDRWQQCDPIVYATLAAAKARVEDRTSSPDWRQIEAWRWHNGNYWIDRQPIYDPENAGLERARFESA